MSRVTAAFVCALCDPDNPRPASIMCSNNCGRYVCAVHAMPRKGPGSPMVCLACAEALGLIEKPQPRSEPTPIVAVPPEPEIKPEPKPTIVAPARVEEPAKADKPIEPAKVDTPIEPAPTAPAMPPVKADTPVEPSPKPEVRPLFDVPRPTPTAQPVEPRPAARLDPGATLVNVPPVKRPDTPVVPAEQQSQTARRLVEPPPPPQSSETIVSQRGNTLQVPKVSQTGPRPAQSTGARPRVAQRAEDLRALDRSTLISLGLSALGGIIGLVLLLIALFGR